MNSILNKVFTQIEYQKIAVYSVAQNCYTVLQILHQILPIPFHLKLPAKKHKILMKFKIRDEFNVNDREQQKFPFIVSRKSRELLCNFIDCWIASKSWERSLKRDE